MVANLDLLTHDVIIVSFLCRARSSTSHTSSRLMVSRLRWRPVLTSTCSLFCSLRLPLHPVLAWPKLYRVRIRSSWWALPSSAVPYRDAWKFLHVWRRRCRKRSAPYMYFWRKSYYMYLSDLWVIDFQMDRSERRMFLEFICVDWLSRVYLLLLFRKGSIRVYIHCISMDKHLCYVANCHFRSTYVMMWKYTTRRSAGGSLGWEYMYGVDLYVYTCIYICSRRLTGGVDRLKDRDQDPYPALTRTKPTKPHTDVPRYTAHHANKGPWPRHDMAVLSRSVPA